MNERDVATLYIAEMRALLPVLRTHLATLGAQPTGGHASVAAEELGRLAMAAADLSADFRAEDCSALTATLARAFSDAADVQPGPAVLAPAADTLTYISERIERMDAAGRILAPTESERSAVSRLLTALAAASGQSVSGALSSLLALDADGSLAYDAGYGAAAPGGLAPARTPEDMARPLPPPVTSWLRSPEDLPAPLNRVPLSAPLNPQFAPTTQLDRRHAPDRPGSPGGVGAVPATGQLQRPPARTGPQEDTALTRPALPVTTNKLPDLEIPAQQAEPARVELSDEDIAILHAFRTRPLRHATRPLVPPDAAEVGGLTSASESDPSAIKPEWQSVFVFETSQDLKDMQESLVAYEQYPQDRARLATMVRTAHKIKGAAGMVNYPLMAELAHAYEEQLGLLRSQQVPMDQRTMSLLIQGLSELERALAGISRGETEDPECVVRMGNITGALRARSAERVPVPPPRAVSGRLGERPVTLVRDTPVPAPPGSDGLGLASVELPATSALASRVTTPDAPLRVDVRRMDDLMNRVSGLAMNRAEIAQVRQVAIETESDMERAITRLSELSGQLADLRFPAETQVPRASARPEHAPAGLVARLLGGERRGQTRPLSEALLGHEAAQTSAQRDLDLEQYTEYDHLVRALAEAVSDISTSATAIRSTLRRLERLDQTQEALASSIQEAVNQMRLVPLNDHVPRLLRAARVLAAQLGKSITVTVRGEMTEIDRDVSEALAESLTQLMRNAVVHGIESPDERVILGKPAEGTIWLHAYYTGSEVNIEIGDDGRGINPDKVLASALVQGIVDQDEMRQLSAQDALKLIFEQGVSGADELSTAAGRGVGMAEVAASIARLRGTIEVRSQPGEGTTFHIRVPISLSIVRALHVRVAGQEYAIPFAAVLQTVPLGAPAGPQAPMAELVPGERRSLAVRIGERDVVVPVYSLAQMLGLPERPAPQPCALIVELGRQYAAFAVDGVVTDREIVVRALPAHLRRRAVRGAAVTPTGEVLLVLDLPQLVNRLSKDGQIVLRRTPTVPRLVPAPLPRILVVDDSLSIRQALVNTLTYAGYTTQTAHDGMEALEMLLESLPALVVLDIEMPRLDGYELLGVMRSHAQLAAIPVVMLTTKGAQQHRQHAEHLGANAYLVKPCPDDELVATIRRLLDQAP